MSFHFSLFSGEIKRIIVHLFLFFSFVVIKPNICSDGTFILKVCSTKLMLPSAVGKEYVRDVITLRRVALRMRKGS